MWIATTQGLYYYDAEKDYFHVVGDTILDHHFVYTLFVDDEDNLWAGMNLYGLYRIDGKTGEVTSFRADTEDDGLHDNYVTCLYQQAGSDTLWVGTNNNGLQFFDMKTSTFGSVSGDQLRPQTTVCSINSDPGGHLWIGTSQGLYQYSPETTALLRYTTESGLPTNQFNFASSLLASEGYLLMGTVNGLVTFDPAGLHSRKGPFEVHLKRLMVNNRIVTAATEGSPLSTELDGTSTLTLSHSQARSFSIEYGVIMPGATNEIEYQVRFEGIDKGWRDVGSERRFMSFNLREGTYYLHVRANNTNEGWNECPEKVLKIVVQPPFYRSGWAYLFYLLVLGGLGVMAVRLFSIRIRERNAVRDANMEKEKIEAVDKAKFDFFTMVSHELKTPLSLIAAPLRSISRQGLTEASQQNLDIAIKNTRKLEGLINELVTFNKVETDSFPFYVQKGNPLTFIEILLISFREMATEKGLTLTSQFENNGEEVWFSPSYVERIVSNLLSNAFKFTPTGGQVEVRACIAPPDDLQATADERRGSMLSITVADTGIGIAKEELPNIFNRYYQTKRGYNVNNSGWGIGLSLVRRLAEVHKGRVWVESEIGRGSTFHVMLNVSEEAFDQNSRTNEDKTIVPLSQYRFSDTLMATDDPMQMRDVERAAQEGRLTILIVDDNQDLLTFLGNYFSSQYNVLLAENGRQALEVAHREQVEMVVSDVMMPEMDGLELCRILKGDVMTSHIPVILLTAKSDQEDVVAGYQCGAEAYVSKPFDPQILDLQVKNILQLQKARQTEIVNTDTPGLDATSLSDLDKEFMHNISEVVSQNIANSEFSIADITEQLGISRSLLHTKMKNLAGMSMGDYIRKKRVDKACQLLKEGFNASETAYRTGFADPSYFSKTFKKITGISPTDYINERNQIKVGSVN